MLLVVGIAADGFPIFSFQALMAPPVRPPSESCFLARSGWEVSKATGLGAATSEGHCTGQHWDTILGRSSMSFLSGVLHIYWPVGIAGNPEWRSPPFSSGERGHDPDTCCKGSHYLVAPTQDADATFRSLTGAGQVPLRRIASQSSKSRPRALQFVERRCAVCHLLP